MAWTTPRTWTDGELVTAAIMNTHIRDNELAMGPHLIARKTSDQSVTSSTTVVDETALVLPLAANEVWQFKYFLVWSADAAGDIRLTFTFPTSGDLRLTAVHPNGADTVILTQWSTTTSPATERILGGNTSTAYITTPLEGVFVNGANAGNLTLRFAQGTSSGTATTIKANSTLWAVKLA